MFRVQSLPRRTSSTKQKSSVSYKRTGTKKAFESLPCLMIEGVSRTWGRIFRKDEILWASWNERLLNELTTFIFLARFLVFLLIYIYFPSFSLPSFSVVHLVRGFSDFKSSPQFFSFFFLHFVRYLSSFFLSFSFPFLLNVKLDVSLGAPSFNLIPAPLFLSLSPSFIRIFLHSQFVFLRFKQNLYVLHLRPTPLTQYSCDHLHTLLRSSLLLKLLFLFMITTSIPIPGHLTIYTAILYD